MFIQEIKLFSNNLESIIDFYNRVLEMPIVERTESRVSFEVGESRLTFERCDAELKPYYHFAFNVTKSKADQIVPWLKARGIVINLTNEKEVNYFKDWNAHSVYFYDPAGNIVEFIARHNTKQESDQPFKREDLLNISEIGMPALDVIALSELLIERYDEQIYLSGDDMFTPIGDEQGLLILSSLDRIWLGSDKKVDIFPLEIVIANAREDTVQLENYPYRITSRAVSGNSNKGD